MIQCKYFNSCGGCQLQHIDYQTQLENKKNLLANSIKFKEIKVFSGNEYYYRNRMDFVFNKTGLAFRKKRTYNQLINIDECIISDDKINELLKELNSFFIDNDYFDPDKHTGTLRSVVIRTNQESSISFILNSDSTKISEAIDKIKEFSESSTADNISIAYLHSHTHDSTSTDYFVVKGIDNLKEKFLDKEFTFNVQGFFQNNTKLAEQMHSYCNNILKEYNTKDATLLDLYAGVGTFGIINSNLFKKVFILESYKQAIESAKINIINNNIKNAEAFNLEAKQLDKLKLTASLFVITDPPRSGMEPKTIEKLNKLKPELIIYISCNIEQLGKDILKFKDYKIKTAALFDLFPQTTHAEAVIELIRLNFNSDCRLINNLNKKD